ncbi:heavy-metal-associated domain-containing protein [Paenarthrobacter sp. YIM B13468]|uniref:heavy-metal-associated domain-containing protein n=1 Tax=Paenarthrobacter sp. YIM B13468 TaxID=3366295 RepID=UPI00366D8B51
MQISSRTELPLTATSSSSSGCGCCSTEARVAPPTSTDVELGVEGLTCGGCVGRLESAVKDVDGVDAAAIELVAGGVSRLLITGSHELAAVHDAVRDAGFTVTR